LIIKVYDLETIKLAGGLSDPNIASRYLRFS